MDVGHGRGLCDNEFAGQWRAKEAALGMRPGYLLVVICAALALSACAGAAARRDAASDQQAAGPTPATLQRSIRVGMSAAAVAETLGSPNTIVTDQQKHEVWTYDEVWAQAAYSASDSNGKILVLDPAQGAGAQAPTALTVIVKFDDAYKVSDFAYHAASL